MSALAACRSGWARYSRPVGLLRRRLR